MHDEREYNFPVRYYYTRSLIFILFEKGTSSRRYRFLFTTIFIREKRVRGPFETPADQLIFPSVDGLRSFLIFHLSRRTRYSRSNARFFEVSGNYMSLPEYRGAGKSSSLHLTRRASSCDSGARESIRRFSLSCGTGERAEGMA